MEGGGEEEKPKEEEEQQQHEDDCNQITMCLAHVYSTDTLVVHIVVMYCVNPSCMNNNWLYCSYTYRIPRPLGVYQTCPCCRRALLPIGRRLTARSRLAPLVQPYGARPASLRCG